MSQAIEQEIRTLRTHFWSARDPEGRAFAPLADAYRRKGDLDEAISLVEDGLARLPDFSPGHLVAARILRARGDLEAAREALDHLLELDSENVLALLERAELARDTGDREGAILGLRRLLSLDPGHLGARAALDRLEAAGPAPETTPAPETAPATERPSEPPIDPAPGADDEAETPGSVPEEALEPEEAELLEFGDTSLNDLDEGTWGLMDDEGEADPSLTPDGFQPTGAAGMSELAEDPSEVEDLPDNLRDAEAGDSSGDLAVFDFGMEVGPEEEPDPSADRPPLDPQGVDPLVGVEGLDDLTGPELDAPSPDVAPSRPGAAVGGELDDGSALSAGADDLPPHLVTRTMAELYLAQGLTEDGLRIYERLVQKQPDDGAARSRLEELRREFETAEPAEDRAREVAESAAVETLGSEEVTDSPSAEEELDEMAPQWSGEEADEAEAPATPFAWATAQEDEGEAVVETGAERSIREHFDDLLAWVPGAVAIGDLSPEAAAERAPAGSPLAERLARPETARAEPAASGAPDADVPPREDAAEEDEVDDDLDDFRSWLESLDP